MNLNTIITYNKQNNTVYDILFIILIKWLNTDANKDKLILHVTSHTNISKDFFVNWLNFLTFEDIIIWSKTEIGQHYIEN